MNHTNCTHCHRPRAIAARGLCSTCYRKLRESGDLDTLYPLQHKRRPVLAPRECARCGEHRRLQGRGLCAVCYGDVKRAGELHEYPTAQERLEAVARAANERAKAEHPHLAATLRQFRAARLRLEARKRNAERRWEAAA